MMITTEDQTGPPNIAYYTHPHVHVSETKGAKNSIFLSSLPMYGTYYCLFYSAFYLQNQLQSTKVVSGSNGASRPEYKEISAVSKNHQSNRAQVSCLNLALIRTGQQKRL